MHRLIRKSRTRRRNPLAGNSFDEIYNYFISLGFRSSRGRLAHLDNYEQSFLISPNKLTYVSLFRNKDNSWDTKHSYIGLADNIENEEKGTGNSIHQIYPISLKGLRLAQLHLAKINKAYAELEKTIKSII